MMLIFEYQPKSKGLKMLSDSVSEILIFKIFLGGMPPDPPGVCFTDYCSTITIISHEMDSYSVLYTLCVANPYILCPSEVSPPLQKILDLPLDIGWGSLLHDKKNPLFPMLVLTCGTNKRSLLSPLRPV